MKGDQHKQWCILTWNIPDREFLTQIRPTGKNYEPVLHIDIDTLIAIVVT